MSNPYRLSMMFLDPALGASLERAARLMTAMRALVVGKSVSVPVAAREVIRLGVDAYFRSEPVREWAARQTDPAVLAIIAGWPEMNRDGVLERAKANDAETGKHALSATEGQ